jgi:RNA polymerase sigma-70 factor (ECF subfamily)
MFQRQRGARELARGRPRGAASDARAFESEALGHLDALYATARRLTRNPTQAEDLVQDTYVKAFRFADRFEAGTNLKAWLFTILHNTFRNQRRDVSRDPVVADSDAVDRAAALSGRAATPEQLLLDRTLDADLQAAFDALPDVFREAVWLRDVQEFTYGEIARMVEVPIGTVMSRIARGRRLLHDRLTSAGGKFRRPVDRPDGQGADDPALATSRKVRTS